MAKSGINRILIIFCSILMGISLFYGCGTPGQLTGGPKDTKPPKVLKMEPKDLSTNFRAKKIVIQFDEYFKINNQQKEFSISPELERQPELKVKKKFLEINFMDSLEKNTTYTLNFGKSIGDINEGNVIKNFTYVFSTGPTLDSLSIKGKVINSLTQLPEIEAVVMLFPLERDSLFGKKRPSIYTTTDSSGNYKLSNLRKGDYKIYTVKDKNSDKIYQQSSDEVGFLKEPIHLKANTNDVNMVMFKEDAAVFRIIDRKLNPDGSIFMDFNQKLSKPELTVTEPSALDAGKLVKFNATKDSVKLWLKDMNFDSVKVSVTDAGKLLQTAKLTRGKKDTYTRTLTATDNLEGNLLNPNRPLRLSFTLPVEGVDLSKITLMEDSVIKKGITIVKDSTDLLSYLVKYPWVAKSIYEIKFGAGAFTAIFKATNKEFSKKFELANKDNYGTLQLKVAVTEKDKQYILQVLDEKKFIVNTNTFQGDTVLKFANYRAGKYFVRIIYDANKNGLWDTGKIAKGIQPEKVYNEPKELSIKANWDRNETITIPKEPSS